MRPLTRLDNHTRSPAAAIAAADSGAPSRSPAAPSGGSDTQAAPRRLSVGILDGDSGLLASLSNRLQKLGWEQRILPVGVSPQALAKLPLDAVTVDLLVLGEKRWAWLGELCRLRPDLGVVICSGQSTVAQRVLGLRLGADDWLTKPCHSAELIARLETAARHQRSRGRRRDYSGPLKIHELEIRPAQYQAFLAGRSLALTLREYHLLELLMLGGAEVQERERIYETLWGREMARGGRSVDVCVHKLRRKLELASPGWSYIQTHYGVGYRLVAEPREAQSPPALAGEPAGERELSAELLADVELPDAALAA